MSAPTYTEGLKKYLTERPAIKHVYFNKDNEYWFHDRPGHDLTVKSRAEILGEETPNPGGNAEGGDSAPLSKQINAEPAINIIEVMEDVQTIEDYVAGEKRKTVLDAAAERIAELNS